MESVCTQIFLQVQGCTIQCQFSTVILVDDPSVQAYPPVKSTRAQFGSGSSVALATCTTGTATATLK